MTDDRRLVLPVGQFGGVTGGAGYTIRRGHDLLTVDPDEGRMWLDAHGWLDQLESATALTRSVLLGRRSLPPAVYDRLLAKGLLVEIDPRGPSAAGFADTHRFVAAAQGLGNRPEEPETFLAGARPDHVAGFTWYMYRLWRRSLLEPTLSAGCRALAAHETCVANDVGADDLRTELLTGIHVLLHVRVAYFDVARLPEDAGPAVHSPTPVYSRDADPDELLVPVGHDLGPLYPGKGKPFLFVELVLGRRTFGLPTADDYAVWARAHGPVERPPLTFRQYRDNLIADGIPDGDGLAYRLSANGLLRQTPTTGDPAADFAQTHRIVPLATALDTADADNRFPLGRPGTVYLYAGEVEHWLWLWGGRYDNLWLAVEAFARTELGARTGDGDPYRCLGPLMLAVQALISHSLAFLETAWDAQ